MKQQLTGEEMVDEVQAFVGRTNDTVLVDDTRVTRWLNEAQENIVRKAQGLKCREVDDATSWYCQSDEYVYDFTNLTAGCSGYVVCHPLELWYRDGNDSRLMDYMPTDEFDRYYPDPTHADYSPDRPIRWTHRGQHIEVGPRPSTDYAAAAAGDTTGVFRFVYTAFAKDFTTNDGTYSDLSRADQGLIYYGVAEAWGAIGEETKRMIWLQKFNAWLAQYIDTDAAMIPWDNSILFDQL